MYTLIGIIAGGLFSLGVLALAISRGFHISSLGFWGIDLRLERPLVAEPRPGARVMAYLAIGLSLPTAAYAVFAPYAPYGFHLVFSRECPAIESLDDLSLDTGWIFVGYRYRDEDDRHPGWVEGPYVSYAGRMTGLRAGEEVEGEPVQPFVPREVVVVGYQDDCKGNYEISPTQIGSTREQDFTGLELTREQLLTVRDQVEAGYPDQPLAVWLRVGLVEGTSP